MTYIVRWKKFCSVISEAFDEVLATRPEMSVKTDISTDTRRRRGSSFEAYAGTNGDQSVAYLHAYIVQHRTDIEDGIRNVENGELNASRDANSKCSVSLSFTH